VLIDHAFLLVLIHAGRSQTSRSLTTTMLLLPTRERCKSSNILMVSIYDILT
jgi:hypothetical protein